MRFSPLIAILPALLLTTLAVPFPQIGQIANNLLETLNLNGLVGNGTPPLPTTIHSPECAHTNNGTYLCCDSTFAGNLPIVVALSAAAEYPLTKNAINGLVNCRMNFGDTCGNPGTELCCGVIALIPAAALYCQGV